MFSFLDDSSQHLSLIYVHFPSLFPLEILRSPVLQIGMLLKEANIHMQYIIDSFPVPICDNIRISRCRIVTGEEFRGYILSLIHI